MIRLPAGRRRVRATGAQPPPFLVIMPSFAGPIDDIISVFLPTFLMSRYGENEFRTGQLRRFRTPKRPFPRSMTERCNGVGSVESAHLRQG